MGASVSGHHTETGRLCRPTAGLTVAPAPSRCAINVGCTPAGCPHPSCRLLTQLEGGPGRCPKAQPPHPPPPRLRPPDQGVAPVPRWPPLQHGAQPRCPARQPAGFSPPCWGMPAPGECLRTRNADTSQGDKQEKGHWETGPSLGGGGPRAQPMTRLTAQASDWSCRAGLPEKVRLHALEPWTGHPSLAASAPAGKFWAPGPSPPRRSPPPDEPRAPGRSPVETGGVRPKLAWPGAAGCRWPREARPGFPASGKGAGSPVGGAGFCQGSSCKRGRRLRGSGDR